jgi:phospholipid transport system transporter-binding protein
MNTPTLTPEGDGRYRLEGELNMQTVPDLLRRANLDLPGTTDIINIDLAGVSRADSAGLALLLDWLRLAEQHQRRLTLSNLPTQLLEIARVSGLQDVLPLANT